MWNIPDTDKIKKFIENNKPKTACDFGGGFIGIEIAENLKELGIDVSLVEMGNQVLAPLDIDMANLLHENIIQNDIKLYLNEKVDEIKETSNLLQVNLANNKKIFVDFVIMSVGITPNSELAKMAKIKTNDRGGIVVSEKLETSVKDIYAIGDVIEVFNFLSNEKTMIPLAGPANKQGRILADILSGKEKKYKGTMGTSIAKVFDLSAGASGLNEKHLISMGKEKNKDYYVAIISQKSHASYYPGATNLVIKLLFTKAGEILGVQIVGQDGVDKRLDVIAATMRLKGSIYDLEELEYLNKPYKALGGNGTVEVMLRTVHKLPKQVQEEN